MTNTRYLLTRPAGAGPVLVQRLPTADEQEALLHWMTTV